MSSTDVLLLYESDQLGTERAIVFYLLSRKPIHQPVPIAVGQIANSGVAFYKKIEKHEMIVTLLFSP